MYSGRLVVVDVAVAASDVVALLLLLVELPLGKLPNIGKPFSGGREKKTRYK